MDIFDKLIKNNEFPIIFIGSGVSKRYLKNSPTWLELLEDLWKKAFDNEEFYARLNQIKNFISEYKYKNKKEYEFKTNIEIASEIEKQFNENFHSGKISIEGLTSKKVFLEEINPFKFYLSGKFKNIETNEIFEKEKENLKKMLDKSKIILTTNYDSLIEKVYKSNENELNIYIGQRGLFKPNLGYCELFKIHGCCTNEKTLILTKEDYQSIEKNLSLVSAKITSELLLSPIIFLGYSLSDINIRNIIQNFIDSLSEEEKQELEERIIFIEWKKNEKDLKIRVASEFGIRITLIETDNYNEIYNKISMIDQGISPWEIFKYKSLIKKTIIDQRESPTTKTIFVAAKQLEEICSDSLKDSKLVISLADQVEYIPKLSDYLTTILDEQEYQDIINKLRFICLSTKGSNGYFPIFKYLKNLDTLNESLLTSDEIQKLEKIYKLQESRCKKLYKKSISKKFNTIKEIEVFLIKNNNFKDSIFENRIIDNFYNLNLDDIKEFLLSKLTSDFVFKTNFRKLFSLYDYRVNYRRN